MAEFYKLVPRDLKGNLEYRIEIRKRAAVDDEFRRALITACRKDFLFWCLAFAYLYEPRPRFHDDGITPKSKTIPFLVWDHQIPVIQAIVENIGRRDIVIEKARGEGMSWIGVLLALWDWLFDDMAKVGLVSNTEKKADDPGNMDSLLCKVEWELTKLPQWMAGKKDVDWTRNKGDHSLVNVRNGSQINAFAATSDAGRAGRYKWFMPDEMGSWLPKEGTLFLEAIRSSTDSRLVISTPNGDSGPYYDFIHTPSNAIKLVLKWEDNPSRNRGLYKFVNGRPVAVDPVNNPLQSDYDPPSKDVLDMFSRLRTKGFKLEKKVRSPWYDNECDKADATPHSIAKELDRDYGGSMYRVFTDDFFETAKKTQRKWRYEGVVEYHPETLEPRFSPVENGPVKVYIKLDNEGNPSRHHTYAVGCDIATGQGGSHASNSSIEVIDLVTKEQAVEIISNSTSPSDWADLAIAVSKWMNNAILGWESGGPGAAFANRVLEFGYSNILMRRIVNKKGATMTREPGYWNKGKAREKLFSDFIDVVKKSEIAIHSEELITECGQFVRAGTNSAIIHTAENNTEDGSSKGEAHGDRVIGFAVAVQAAKERPLPKLDEDELIENPPPGTLAEREKMYRDSQREESEWDSRTNSDLARRTTVCSAGLRFRRTSQWEESHY